MFRCAASKLRATQISGVWSAVPDVPGASFRLGAGFILPVPGLVAWVTHLRAAWRRSLSGTRRGGAGLGRVAAVQYNQSFREGRTRFFRAMRVCIFFP